jgi:hypothetical protein
MLTQKSSASSTDIAPQPSPDFVPPMLLQSSSSSHQSPQTYNQHSSYIPNHQLQNQMSNALVHHNQHSVAPVAPHSAPANIVFQNIHGHLGGGSGSNINSPYGPMPSPAELEFEEMSPLTSPWLGAYNGTSSSGTPMSNSNHSQQQSLQDKNLLQSGTAGVKRRTRTTSSGSDEATGNRGRSTRKRPTHITRLPPSNPQSSTRNSTQTLRGGTQSANSTPVFPATHGPIPLPANRANARRTAAGSAGDIPGDSPSPVDLSMPPPAAPSTSQQAQPDYFIPNSPSSAAADSRMEGNEQPILPVTPSSIMNLGRLVTPSSLASAPQKSSKKSTRPRSATVSTNIAGERVPLTSPALKRIRPGECFRKLCILLYR